MDDKMFKGNSEIRQAAVNVHLVFIYYEHCYVNTVFCLGESILKMPHHSKNRNDFLLQLQN